MEEMGHSRQRGISLEAHEEFMEDDIGDIDQPSQISGFYCPPIICVGLAMGLDDLIVVGKQVVIHAGQENRHGEVKIEPISSH